MPVCGDRRCFRLARDLAYSFRRSPVAIVSAAVLAVCLVGAMFAPWVAPHNPFDLATLNLLDALSPPHGMDGRPTPAICSAPTTRAATCCRRSCSARASRCWSGSRRWSSRWCSASASDSLAGYVGGKRRRLHHAHRRRAAFVSGDPDRAADRRRRARASCRGTRTRSARAVRARSSPSASRTGCNTRARCAARRWSRRTRNTSRRRG